MKVRSRGRARQEDDYGVFELPPELEAGDLLLVLADGMGANRRALGPAP